MTLIKSILFGLLFHAYLSSARQCKNCSQRKNELPVEEMRLLRCEYIKNQILQKLRLAEPPNPNLPKPPKKTVLIIAELAENSTIDTEDQTKLESVVIYPRQGNLTCIRNEIRPCSRLEFTIPESLSVDKFISAEIWFHQQNLTRSIRVDSIVADPIAEYSRIFEFDDLVSEKTCGNWRKYSLPNIISFPDYFSDNILDLEISVTENGTDSETVIDESGEEKPFMIIRLDETEEPSRKRRSITCTEQSTSCCKENFFLNFSEIGWDNWILHPDGYQANFCRGRCFNDLSNTRFYHSAVLLSYIRDNRDIAEEIGLNMCCTPSVMAPVTIIYRNEEGHIYHKTIENMKVESCDCA